MNSSQSPHNPNRQAQNQHWKKRLAGCPRCMDAYLDFARPPVSSYRRGHATRSLSAAVLVSSARRIGWDHVCSPAMIAAALAMLLWRATGQTDVVFTLPSPESIRQNMKGEPEKFTNVVPLRLRLLPGQAVSEFVRTVARVVVEAGQHRDVPFDGIVDGVFGGRTPYMVIPFGMPCGFSETCISTEHVTSIQRYVMECDAVFTCSVADGEGVLSCDYDHDLYSPETALRLLDRLQEILVALVGAPNQMLSEVSCISDEERKLVLQVWNATQCDLPLAPCVHVLFQDQCARTPDAIAARDGDRSLTYSELNTRANQLAYHLHSLGVSGETRIGVCMGRSVNILIAVLGIWKAGATYVPIDPAVPRNRQDNLLADSRIETIITDDVNHGMVLPAGVRLIPLSALWPTLSRLRGTNPTKRTSGQHLAYIMYTSGSTGGPKGVEIEHRSVTNALLGINRELRLTQSDVLLAVTSISFDISVLELFLPLLTGGRVVFVPAEETVDGTRLIDHLSKDGITVMQATPSTWRLLIDCGWLGSPIKALCGGETLPPLLASQLTTRTESLWNVYGPTETTIWSTICRVGDDSGPIPIGRPLTNTRVYLLDDYLQPVPIGALGELYIGGLGVGRGYSNQADLTGARFVPDPFSRRPGSRMYQTGDRARWKADGTLEFHGRRDFQVKLRGHRVELGEIETALALHPHVKQAIVTLHEEKSERPYLVAYLVPMDDHKPSQPELMRFLRAQVPEVMVPATYVIINDLPLTLNGKVDRKALPVPPRDRPDLNMDYIPAQTDVESSVASLWESVLGITSIGLHDNFFDLGGHSLLLAKVHADLEQMYHAGLTMNDMLKYPTIHALARRLAAGSGDAENTSPAIQRVSGSQRNHIGDGAIAIVGMAGRFPGARNLAEFWHNLYEGVESISSLSTDEVLVAGIDPDIANDYHYVKAEGLLEDYDCFDARFFGFSAREADLTDPQHRNFLACAWEALENAGYDPRRHRGTVGVFAGCGMNTYLVHNLSSFRPLLSGAGGISVMIANDKDFLASKVSYRLNLTGPSVVVQTACSTSLVAVHLACQAIRGGECDMALAGAVSVRIPQRAGYLYQQGSIYSPDGHCRPFDANAKGTVFGSGVGVVVLKRLTDAIRDGDHIWAVIRGSAVNNDGAVKVGYATPSVEGQAQVIRSAHGAAGISPETITLVETHGTGTMLGDPVEIEALTQAFRAGTDKIGFCAIGSVKSNIGHLDAAAGMAGLIKTVLALANRVIPPTLHFTAPNPAIDFAGSPFYVNSSSAVWKEGAAPRRAGVSSFGIGGTNAHIVLEEAPAIQVTSPERPYQLLLVSARSASSLAKLRENLAADLQDRPNLSLADVAYTLQIGRTHFDYRYEAVCHDTEGAILALRPDKATCYSAHRSGAIKHNVVFMFSGQGTQQAGMARDLYSFEPGFRKHLDACADILRRPLNLDIRDILYSRQEDRLAVTTSEDTYLAQPILFAIEYALAQYVISLGVRPAAMIGHSLGEYVAACLAGVFSLEDALTLLVRRGELMQGLAEGAMIAVRAQEAYVAPLLAKHPDVSVAAANAESLCTLSGPVEAIEVLERRLNKVGIKHHRLRVTRAFHSAMMDPIMAEFARRVAEIQLNTPQVPYVSNLTGSWVSGPSCTDPMYWAQHMRHTVRFKEGLTTLLAQQQTPILLELGPGRALQAIAMMHPLAPGRDAILGSLPRTGESESDLAYLLNMVGHLWSSGLDIDGNALHSDESRQRVPLPTYPFECERHSVNSTEAVSSSFAGADKTDVVVLPPNAKAQQKTPTQAAVEIVLADIWRQVLGTEIIGPDEDFFELGGDSLVAIQVVARIHQAFGEEIPLKAFFEQATIRGVAAVLVASLGVRGM